MSKKTKKLADNDENNPLVTPSRLAHFWGCDRRTMRDLLEASGAEPERVEGRVKLYRWLDVDPYLTDVICDPNSRIGKSTREPKRAGFTREYIDRLVARWKANGDL